MTENKKHIFTVAELNRHAKDVLEDQFAEISVMGEISGIALSLIHISEPTRR